MRTLTASSDAARQLRSYQCVACLKISFGGAVGDIYFTSGWQPTDISSSSLRRVVSDWGELAQRINRDKTFTVSRAAVNLIDQSGELREWWDDIEFQRLAGELRWGIWTPGEASPSWSDASSILSCTVVPPVSWSESDRMIRVELADISAQHHQTTGLYVTRELSEYLEPKDEGRIVPLVYGHAKKVSAIGWDLGAAAKLAADISSADTTLYVDDASRFPQGEEITIQIGLEQIVGSFAGNVFTATERGKIIHTGSTTEDSPSTQRVVDSALIGTADGTYVGQGIEIDLDPDTGGNAYCTIGFQSTIAQTTALPTGDQAIRQGREILRFDGSTGTIEYSMPFTVDYELGETPGGNFVSYGYTTTIKAGSTYRIRSFAEAHTEGDDVILVRSPVKYLVARGSCTIKQVYVHGYRRPIQTLQQPGGRPMAFGSLIAAANIMTLGAARATFDVPKAPKVDWVLLAPELWSQAAITVNGETCTGVQIATRPSMIGRWVVDTDEILVDVDGPKDGETVIRNPAAVMAHICDQFTGLTLETTDAETRLANWKMDFALDIEYTIWDLLAELAFLARCRLRLSGDAPELVYQFADGGTSSLTIGPAQRFPDSIELSRELLDVAFSEVLVRWREAGTERRYLVTDSGAESRFGRRTLEIDAWPYGTVTCPQALAKFMLKRVAHLHDVVSLDASIHGVGIEPSDVITLDDSQLPYSMLPAQVVEIGLEHGLHPGRPSRTRLSARLHRWAGCGDRSCEGDCETAGCETTCESEFEPTTDCWDCEGTCQTLEEFGCKTSAEELCALPYCESGFMIGCNINCQADEIACGPCVDVQLIAPCFRCLNEGGDAGCGDCESGCESDESS